MDCPASHNHGPAGYDPICLGFQVGPDDRIGSSSLLQQHIGEHDLLALSPLKLIVQVSVTLALIDQLGIDGPVRLISEVVEHSADCG